MSAKIDWLHHESITKANFCDTCCHQYSDICGTCETLEGVPVKYSEKPKASTLPDELTPYAVELITKCPQLINLFAEKINRMINNFEPSDPDHTEALEPIEISHVGYSMAQCGYDK